MSNPEANFMLAAEKAIADLQLQAQDAARAAAVAKTAADSALHSAKKWRTLTILLGIVVAATLVLSGFGVVLWLQQSSATSELRQQAITSCDTGNERANDTIASLNELVTLLEGPHPTAEVRKIAANYENFVAAHNISHNCQQAYSAKDASGG